MTVPDKPWVEVIIDETQHYTLCVVDDLWVSSYIAHNTMSSDSSLDVKTCAERLGGDDELTVHKKVMVYILEYAKRLEGLRRLVIGDFPRTERGTIIDHVLSDGDATTAVVFLIDVWDDKRKTNGIEVLKQLESRSISAWRCSILTVGYSQSSAYHKIVKDTLVENGGKDLVDWWNKIILGTIDNELFKSYGSVKRVVPHDPSKISAATVEAPMFRNFLKLQADRDSYSVWHWIRDLVERNADLPTVRYAYLCGKAFLSSGNFPGMPPASPFAFTALRGLVWGCRRIWLSEWDRNHLNTHLLTINEENVPFPADIDDIFCQGSYSTGKKPFQELVLALVAWLKELASGHNATEYLEEIRLTREGDQCSLVFLFSGPLGESAFEQQVRLPGLVHDRWTPLSNCFAPHAQPYRNRSNQEVTLRFPVVEQARPVNQTAILSVSPPSGVTALRYALFNRKDPLEELKFRGRLEASGLLPCGENLGECVILLAHANSDRVGKNQTVTDNYAQVIARGGIFLEYTTGSCEWSGCDGQYKGDDQEFLRRLNSLSKPISLEQLRKCLDIPRDTPTLLALLLMCEAHLALGLDPLTGQSDFPADPDVVNGPELDWTFNDAEAEQLLHPALRDPAHREARREQFPLLPPTFASNQPMLRADVLREWGEVRPEQLAAVLALCEGPSPLRDLVVPAYRALRTRLGLSSST